MTLGIPAGALGTSTGTTKSYCGKSLEGTFTGRCGESSSPSSTRECRHVRRCAENLLPGTRDQVLLLRPVAVLPPTDPSCLDCSVSRLESGLLEEVASGRPR